MRLLVAPHDLQIGGSQINAIDLAFGAARAGHDVAVYGVPGPLVERIEALGLDFIPARPLRYRPAPSRIVQIAAVARRRRLDLIHTYEWPPCLEAYYGAHLISGVPLLCTVLSMSVSPFVPRSVPLVMGTEALGDEARAHHHAPVWVLEPPIDVVGDHPTIDGTSFREARCATDDSLLIVTVSRLAVDLKLDALVQAIDAVDLLAGRFPVRLVIVGGGPAAAALEQRAADVNRRWNRPVVSFTGSMADPREAYAAADVVVGMGSSALRAMAIGRPVVVQGEAGFSTPVAPDTAPYFLRHGFWGRAQEGWTVHQLCGQLAALLEDPVRREELGSFGRGMVEARFSLARGLDRQLAIYDEVVGRGRPRSAVDAAVVALRAVRLELDNHNPLLKHARRRDERSLLSAAGRVTAQHAYV